MKRTPEIAAKVVRILFCKCCNSSENYNSVRLEKAKLKLLAGLTKLDNEYLAALKKSLFDNNILLYDFGKYYVFADIPQLGNAPKIPQELFNKLLPIHQEIEFHEESGCHWSVNHPVWKN